MSQAQEVLESAVKNQPKKRGCFRGCFIAVLVLALLFWWFCLHTTPLRVSKETTYVLGPLTSDGKRIDYFLAMEERYYPPEMKTDDNGYRLIVRACGDMVKREESRQDLKTGKWVEVKGDPEPYRLQVYEKLGLDPNVKPTVKKIECPYTIMERYASEQPENEEVRELRDKFSNAVRVMWTFNDFPMLEDWLKENTAGLDLIGVAVRKPAFRIPCTRENENAPIFESWLHLGEVQMVREWARALQARANYRLGIGDIDGATYDIVTIYHIARHAGKQGTFVCGLVGIAIEGMARAIGIGSNPEFPPTKEQIEHLIAELDALPPRWTIKECLESERLFGLAACQDMYWGNLPGHIVEPFPYFRHLLPNMTWTLDINIALARINNVYDTFLIPIATGEEKTLEDLRDLCTLSGNPYNPLPLLSKKSRSHRIMDSLMSLLIPSIQAAREAWQRMECVENMQRLTLALLLYEKEHGSLPEGDWRAALKTADGRQQTAADFRCPSHRLTEGETNYAMIGDVPNGVDLPNRILIAEVMQPQKLGEGEGRIPFRKAAFEQNSGDLGSYHAGGINIGLRSGSVSFISKTMRPEEFQKLLDGTATGLP
jgi:hypothetical protein